MVLSPILLDSPNKYDISTLLEGNKGDNRPVHTSLSDILFEASGKQVG